jgi:hypothetical protein
MFRAEEAKAAALANKHVLRGRGGGLKDDEKRRQAEHRVRSKAFDGFLGEIATAAEGNDSPALWQIVAENVIWNSGMATQRVLKRRGLTSKPGYDRETLIEHTGTLNGKQLRGLVLELLLANHAPGNYCNDWSDRLKTSVKALGLRLPGWKVQTAGKSETRERKPETKAQAKAETKPAKKPKVPVPVVRTEAKEGTLSAKVLAALEAAGEEGVTVRDLAKTLGTSTGGLSVWFSTTGKEYHGVQKLGPGKYAIAQEVKI